MTDDQRLAGAGLALMCVGNTLRGPRCGKLGGLFGGVFAAFGEQMLRQGMGEKLSAEMDAEIQDALDELKRINDAQS